MKREYVLWFLKWTFGSAVTILIAGLALVDGYSRLDWRLFSPATAELLVEAFYVLLVICSGMVGLIPRHGRYGNYVRVAAVALLSSSLVSLFWTHDNYALVGAGIVSFSISAFYLWRASHNRRFA